MSCLSNEVANTLAAGDGRSLKNKVVYAQLFRQSNPSMSSVGNSWGQVSGLAVRMLVGAPASHIKNA